MVDGLKKLDAAGHVSSLPVAPGNPRGTSAAGIMAVTESRSGQLWIGTFGGGANVLDPATGLVRQLPFGNAPGDVSSASVTSIVEDSRGNFWIGTDGGGLNLARADGAVTKVFAHDPKDAGVFSGKFRVLDRDRCREARLGRYRSRWSRAGRRLRPTRRSRFASMSLRGRRGSSDTIYGVVPDAAGGIWVTTNAGLMRFDPETRAIQAFHREDGLQGEEFASGAFFRLRDGRLAFGGPGGFNVFDTAKTHGEPASAAHRDHRGICARSAPRYGQAFVAARLAGARLPRQLSCHSISACSTSLLRGTTGSRIGCPGSATRGSIWARSAA